MTTLPKHDPEQIKYEALLVKELGEKIGYGNMMAFASALWRKMLKDKGYPVSGAFVPTLLLLMKQEDIDDTELERKMYDDFVANLTPNRD